MFPSWFDMIFDDVEMVLKLSVIDVKEDTNDDRHYWDIIKLAKRSELVEWENGMS